MANEKESAAARRELVSLLERRLGPVRLRRIGCEASLRRFFRIHRRQGPLVAMVYPQAAADEIGRILRFAEILGGAGISVPRIHEVIEERIVIEEDLGDTLLQKRLRGLDGAGRARVVGRCADLLARLAAIGPAATAARLDGGRMKWELDFFLEHFPLLAPASRPEAEAMRPLLHGLVDEIGAVSLFAHRDFHTRNMLWHRERIYLVDFQDALVAPPLYDLVSLAYDAYHDWGLGRDELVRSAERRGLPVDRRPLLLTALQRNVKALGTFARQVAVRGNRRYRRYIPRTLAYVRRNLRELGDRRFRPLEDFFSRLSA